MENDDDDGDVKEETVLLNISQPQSDRASAALVNAVSVDNDTRPLINDAQTEATNNDDRDALIKDHEHGTNTVAAIWHTHPIIPRLGFASLALLFILNAVTALDKKSTFADAVFAVAAVVVVLVLILHLYTLVVITSPSATVSLSSQVLLAGKVFTYLIGAMVTPLAALSIAFVIMRTLFFNVPTVTAAAFTFAITHAAALTLTTVFAVTRHLSSYSAEPISIAQPTHRTALVVITICTFLSVINALSLIHTRWSVDGEYQTHFFTNEDEYAIQYYNCQPMFMLNVFYTSFFGLTAMITLIVVRHTLMSNATASTTNRSTSDNASGSRSSIEVKKWNTACLSLAVFSGALAAAALAGCAILSLVFVLSLTGCSAMFPVSIINGIIIWSCICVGAFVVCDRFAEFLLAAANIIDEEQAAENYR